MSKIMIPIKKFYFVLGCFLSFHGIASTTGTFFTDHFKQTGWQPLITLTGGAAFTSNAGTTNNIPPQNGIFSFYNYKPNQSTQTQSYLGGFLGAEHLIRPQWLVQAGLSYYQPSSFGVHGIVSQGVNVATQNQYAYQYSIKSYQLLAEGKLLYKETRWNRFLPYLSGGIGAAWNNARYFNVMIVPMFTTFSNQFANHSSSSFSYSVGAGVDIDVAQGMRLGVGYRFIDLGRVATGYSTINDVSTNYTLSQQHFYLNAVAAQFTFDLL